MTGTDNDSQFKFLIACIKHSTNGKVDFQEVADECGIISKGAAAKRYERLMKAHGISGTGAAKPSPVKKEAGASKARANKKRKLESVDENAGDIDEPAIKGEVKSEVKHEDAIGVKSEHGNGGGIAAMAPPALPAQPGTPRGLSQDDDDEVLLISSAQKTDSGVPVYGNSHYHPSTPASPHVPGIHSFDYPANMSFPAQPMTINMIPRAGSGQALPYGFPGGVHWPHHHDNSGLFWQGMATQRSQGHKEN